MVNDRVLAGYFKRIKDLASEVVQEEPKCLCVCCKAIRKIEKEAAKGLKRCES